MPRVGATKLSSRGQPTANAGGETIRISVEVVPGDANDDPARVLEAFTPFDIGAEGRSIGPMVVALVLQNHPFLDECEVTHGDKIASVVSHDIVDGRFGKPPPDDEQSQVALSTGIGAGPHELECAPQSADTSATGEQLHPLSEFGHGRGRPNPLHQEVADSDKVLHAQSSPE